MTAARTPDQADWQIVVGLEVHVQLLTNSKLFSPAPSSYGDRANENVDVVDVALPGSLPVPNAAAVDMALALGLALGCTVRRHSVFARKHYFYPDLPKGYQISQFDAPILEGGAVPVDGRLVPLTRIHLEEDAGKSLHAEGEDASFLDYNRAGTPLLEVVSEPALAGADEAERYFRALRRLVMALGICDGNLAEGSMRADANVSVRRPGAALGQRVELKNLNSPRFLALAVEHEARRQVAELSAGRAIVQQTRQWDADRGESRVLRTKEDAEDYRYFEDPDLPPLVVTEAQIARVRAALPELPDAKRDRFVQALGLSAEDAAVLTSEREIAALFEGALAVHGNARALANWVKNEVLAVVNARGLEPSTVAQVVSAPALGALVQLLDEGAISGKTAKDVFAELASGRGTDPVRIVDGRGWRLQRDDAALARTVGDVIAANAADWQKLVGGKDKLLGFFVGAVMKKSGGTVDPKTVSRLLQEALAKARG
ncbi:MAG: Asp-tRNA(Asn)/Glu-tRNA(Gln) amidotransferase subunit GatB [Deltaproteobacteria bacterium]|nr:Asp-tRNA(Asn)/Glu-tRNA(Gln) amidotransferase subunit GatB [Deltaproteobacteria bacterium]